MKQKMQSQFCEIHDLTGNGNRIHIMREDLLPFSMGGNKVRIADEFFEDMERKGCDTMIAYGSISSNLCRVIANRCFQKKIPCYIICSGKAKDGGVDETANSRLMCMLNGKMVYCDSSHIAETVEKTMKEIEETGHRPYYIYGNKWGTGNEGVSAAAYAKAYSQIQSYECETGVQFDYIFHASGTGATQAGLICGHLLAGDHIRIMGILISSREYNRAVNVIKDGMRDYFLRAGKEYKEAYEKEIHLLTDYTKGGYGIYDEDILRCIRQEFGINSLALDPIYTGKAFWGMKQYIQREELREKNILFIHTGGTPLFYDCLNRGELL